MWEKKTVESEKEEPSCVAASLVDVIGCYTRRCGAVAGLSRGGDAWSGFAL